MILGWISFVDFVDDDHELIMGGFDASIHDGFESCDVYESLMTEIHHIPSQPIKMFLYPCPIVIDGHWTPPNIWIATQLINMNDGRIKRAPPIHMKNIPMFSPNCFDCCRVIVDSIDGGETGGRPLTLVDCLFIGNVRFDSTGDGETSFGYFTIWI
jgi:hypothetical protein